MEILTTMCFSGLAGFVLGFLVAGKYLLKPTGLLEELSSSQDDTSEEQTVNLTSKDQYDYTTCNPSLNFSEETKSGHTTDLVSNPPIEILEQTTDLISNPPIGKSTDNDLILEQSGYNDLLEQQTTDADLIAAIKRSNNVTREPIDDVVRKLVMITQQLTETLDKSSHIPQNEKLRLGTFMKEVPKMIMQIVDNKESDYTINNSEYIPHFNESEYLMNVLTSLQ